MKSFFKTTFGIITFVGAIATVIGVYIQWDEKRPTLNVKVVSIDNLTLKPKISSLKASYHFNDSVVHNLWKAHYLVENTGDAIIVTEGPSKNILLDHFRIHGPAGFKILNKRLENNNFPVTILSSSNENAIDLDFLQWRPGEYLSLQIYFEGSPGDTLSPSIRVNEREIYNGEVIYSTLKESAAEPKPLAEYVPKYVSKPLQIAGIIVFGLLFLIMPIGFFVELKEWLDYRSWKNDSLPLFNEWVAKLVNDGKLKKATTPENFPKELWQDFPGKRPQISSSLSLANLSLVVFLVMLFSIIPLLWMIEW